MVDFQLKQQQSDLHCPKSRWNTQDITGMPLTIKTGYKTQRKALLFYCFRWSKFKNWPSFTVLYTEFSCVVMPHLLEALLLMLFCSGSNFYFWFSNWNADASEWQVHVCAYLNKQILVAHLVIRIVDMQIHHLNQSHSKGVCEPLQP